MELDWLTLLLNSLVIFTAALVHGVAGFADGQVMIGLMSLYHDPAYATIIFSILGIFTNGRVFWSVRKSFVLRDWIVPSVSAIVSLPFGLYLFHQLDARGLKIVIGALLIISAILLVLTREGNSLISSAKFNVHPNGFIGVIAGILSGITCGTVGLPGPPMIVFTAFLAISGILSSTRMKALLTAFIGIMMISRLTGLFISGDVELRHFRDAAVTLPFLFLGSWVGIRIFNSIPKKSFHIVVISLLAINGAVLLIASLI